MPTPKPAVYNVESSVLRNFGLEIGGFTIISTLLSILILAKIKGKFSNIEGYFARKKWDFIETSPNSRSIAVYFKLIVIMLIFYPFFSLFAWGGAVLQSASDNNLDPVPGICILLVGLAIFCWIFVVCSLIWSNFKLSSLTVVMLILGTLLFYSYQLLAILKESDVSFFGLSAVFLSLNGMTMCLMIFIAFGGKSGTLLDLIKDHMSPEPNKSSPEADTVDQLIQKQSTDPNYKLTQEEFFQLFTVTKSATEFRTTALSGGLQRIYMELTPKGRIISQVLLYIVSVGILIAYAGVSNKYTPYQTLGPLTAFAVFTTDTIILLLMKSKITNGPIQIATLVIVFRIFFFAFGGELWFFGYCLLYIFNGAVLSYSIINQYYPTTPRQSTKNNVALKNVANANAPPETGVKWIFHKLQEKAVWCMFTPEFIYFYSSLLFAVIMIYVKQGKMNDAVTNGFTNNGQYYEFYVFGILSIFLNFILASYMFSLRIFYRKMFHIHDEMKHYVISKKCSLYYMSLFITYVLIVVLGVIWALQVKQYLILMSCIFLPLIYESILVFYYNWRMNDFQILADVAAYNAKIKKFKEQKLKSNKETLAIKMFQDKNQKAIEASDNQEQRKEEDLNKEIESILKEVDVAVGNDVNKVQEAMQKANLQESHEDISLFLVGQGFEQIDIDLSYPELPDWRTLEYGQPPVKMGFFRAFLDKQLMKTDYRIIFSGLFMLICMIIYSALVGALSQYWKLLGTTLSISILVFLLVFLPLKQYFATLVKPNSEQIVLIVFGILLNFGWGIYYYVTTIQGQNIETSGSVYYLMYFVFAVPWGILFISGLMKWSDNNWQIKVEVNKVMLTDRLLVTQGITSICFSLASSGFLMWARGYGAGAGLLAFWFFVYYGLLFKFIYETNNKSLPRRFLLISGFLVFCVCLLALILSLVFDSFNDFAGFSISYLTLSVGLLIWSYFRIQSDMLKSEEEPQFYSPWVFPIYQYNSKLSIVSENNRPTIGFMFSLFLLLFWFISLTVWVNPAYIGVAACCICEILIFLIIILEGSWTSQALGEILSKINPKMIRGSWLNAQKAFLTSKGAANNEDVLSYAYFKKDSLAKLADINKIQKEMGTNQYIFQQLKVFYQDYYTAQKKQYDAFNDQIRLVVHFILSLFMAYHEQEKEEWQKFVTFVNNSRQKLLALGIIFAPDSTSSDIKVRYHNFMLQVATLTENQKMRLYQLQQRFEQRKKDLELKNLQQEKEQEILKQQRQEEIQQKLQQQQLLQQQMLLQQQQQQQQLLIQQQQQQQQQQLQDEINQKNQQNNITNPQPNPNVNPNPNPQPNPNVNPNPNPQPNPGPNPNNNPVPNNNPRPGPAPAPVPSMPILPDIPIDQMPDCPEKLMQIILEYQQTKQKYEDHEFTPKNSGLSSDMLSQCKSWRRPQAGSSLFKDKYSPMDVHQGYIGDCYYISAISVIGEQHIQEVCLIDDPRFNYFGNDRWECGAYIVRFIFDQQVVYVVIDDLFPVDSSDEWLLGHAEDDKELWPNVLQKAYAKINGSFEKIQGGKVSFAVAELTGGVPEEIILKEQEKNPQKFWSELQVYKQSGYIMGAGSPSHEQGDRATSDEGIVFGHAYSVLDVRDLDGNKLVQLRNPHGNRGAEWTGDWSDNNFQWTQRLKTLGGIQFKEDGMFWMSFEDFIYNYRAVYLCRIFEKSIWTEYTTQGRWEGTKAAGLPTKKFPKAIMANNPHYGIEVTQQCEAYISLTIQESIDRFRGQYPIYFVCQKNSGKRVSNLSADQLTGTSGAPINLQTIGSQMVLDAPTYPYTFSLMVSTFEGGSISDYNLTIYCTDSNLKVVQADDFPK